MKAIELKNLLDEIFSKGKEYENLDVVMTGMVWSDKFAWIVEDLYVNENPEFGKIIEIS